MNDVENLVRRKSDNAHNGFQTTKHQRYGFANSSLMKLGTSMEFGIVVELPGWAKEGVSKLEEQCKAFNLMIDRRSGTNFKKQGKILIVCMNNIIAYCYTDR